MRGKVVYVGVHLFVLAMLTGAHLVLTIAVLVLSMGPLNFDIDTPPPPPTIASRLFDVLFVVLSFPIVTLARDLAEATRIRLFNSDLFLVINSFFWGSVMYTTGRWLVDRVRRPASLRRR